MILSKVVIVEIEPYSKLDGRIVCKFRVAWTAWSLLFVG